MVNACEGIAFFAECLDDVWQALVEFVGASRVGAEVHHQNLSVKPVLLFACHQLVPQLFA